MTDPSLHRASARGAALANIAAISVLAILIASLHGWCLNDGLFMDDWPHFRQLREASWSLGDLVAACRLELVGGIINAWFMPDVTLRFFRPVAFAIMKLTYQLSDWNPLALHVASLGWHLTACTLLMFLLRRLGASRWWALVIAAMFAVHPGHVATVQWIASQSELIVTTFLLGATLCYARWRGWGDLVEHQADSPSRIGGWPWLVASILLFVAGLGCRENAIMFPAAMAIGDIVHWWYRRRPSLWVYAIFAALVIGYLALRSSYLGGMALPPKPYVIPPGDPGFLRYIFDKACYYWIGEFLFVPCVPIGGLPYLRDQAVVFYGLTALAIFLTLLAWWTSDLKVARWLGPAWLVLFMGPLLPAFESPHHLYLPGIGWAIVAYQLVRHAEFTFPARGPLHRAGQYFLRGGAIALTAALGGATYMFSLALDTGQRMEDRVFDEVASTPHGLHDGDTVYLLNFPLLAHYVKLGVEERLGLHDLNVQLLTWAPRLMGLVGSNTPTELTWVDDRTIEVRIERDAYFAGPLGLMVAEASGNENPLLIDGPQRHSDFTVEILDRSALGISALRFTFDHPIDGQHHHLFWGSQIRWAYDTTPVPPEAAAP